MKKEEKNLSTEEKMIKVFKTCNEIITIFYNYYNGYSII